MDVKAQTRKAYELFGKGDMETFFNDMIDDNIVWTFPGKEGVHPLSGVHKGKQAMMAAMSKIPSLWPNFHLKILDMISEGNKVLLECMQLLTIWTRYLDIILSQVMKEKLKL